MKLIELYVDNLKAATNVTLELLDLTALVGVNGSGKTTLLEALDHFFNDTDIAPSDFKNKEAPITISVKFIGVPGKKKPVKLTKEWKIEDGKSEMTDKITRDLKWNVRETIFKRVHVIFERAEHETDNDGTDKSSLDLVQLIKNTVNDEIKKTGTADLLAQTDAYYQTLKANIAEFDTHMNLKLAGSPADLTGYAPGSTVDFKLMTPNLEPGIETAFLENGVAFEHRSMGHGTKRAYHMAALETHAEMSNKNSSDLILLLVDEPELHQHPHRQRLILQTYKKLVHDSSCQIVYSTHSPEFIDLKESHSLYRVSNNDELNIVVNSGPDIEDKLLHWHVSKKLVEGIFSAGVVLVEGWADWVILNSIFSATHRDEMSIMKKFIERDINVIYCHGVTNMPEFVRFFRELGIPVFAMWDADGKDSTDVANQNMLDAMGTTVSFVGSQPCNVYHSDSTFVCFACDACMYFKDHLGFAGTDDSSDTKKRIKRLINEKGNFTDEFSAPGFQESEFATVIIPSIYDYFFTHNA